ncbi:MAG TPA: alkaline phosphatase family protein [Roseiarcus sp.]|nr:alkaline phosphatase family protein [Roseiarcus sp.]
MSKTIGVSLFALMIAGSAQAQQVGDVFYIALENHNFTQPSSLTDPEQILGNAAAPYINSLVTPGNPNAAQTSYASMYLNAAVGLHPSEPNYVWQEAGLHGPLNDADPYPNNIVNAPNLSGLLQAKYGTSGWRSYQEDTDLLNTSGQNFNSAAGTLTNNVASPSQYEVPLTSFSGTSADYTNAYNGSHQYNYAAKHDPQVFFTDTNGGDNPTSSNPEAQYYAPLQQLQTDLNNNTVARYNWITPDQYNDMHSSLSGGFTYHGVHYTGDQAAVAEGDNFVSMIVPEIMASEAYKDNGAIVIWNDESEGGDTSQYTLTEIIISPLAKGNAYTNEITYTHSSDLRTLQDIFGVYGDSAYLGGAEYANTLSDLFVPGAIPPGVPEPSTWAMMLAGFAGLAAAGYRRKAGGVALTALG